MPEERPAGQEGWQVGEGASCQAGGGQMGRWLDKTSKGLKQNDNVAPLCFRQTRLAVPWGWGKRG